MSRASSGPARRSGNARSRPSNRAGVGREADRIKSTRTGWAAPVTAARKFWRTGPLPVPLAGVAAGLWAALTGLVITTVLTLVIWIFAAGESSSDTAMRVGSDIWLAAHATPFSVGLGVWSLMPWAWMVFPGVILWAAGRWVAHRAAIAHPKSLASAAGSLAGAYALVGLLAALFGTLSAGAAMPLRAVLHTGLAAFLISGAAMAWRARLGRESGTRAWHLARPAVAAFAVLVAGAAAVLVVALLASHGQMSRTLADIGPGLFGTAALAVAWLGYVPAALMWALSCVTGAGVQLGQMTVTPTMPVPATIDFLGLQMLPATRQPWWLAGLLIPVAAGVMLSRIAGPAQSWRRWLADRGVALAIVLVAVDLWWAISVGRLGEGRLDVLGPSPSVIPVLMAGTVLGVAGELAAVHALGWWRARSVIDLTEAESVDDDVPAG